MSRYQIQMAAQMTPWVKKLLIVNIAIWVALILVVQNFFMDGNYIFQWFGLEPFAFLTQFTLWQVVTYMFIHSQNVFHIVFNMLVLWLFGTELEQRLGGKYFITYYMACGVGAALIYLIGVFIYYFSTGDAMPLRTPVIGASGAVFGIILAYGIIFSERTLYFMMLFPMKAKYFALILAGIEVVSLLSSGFGSDVANLAHLGGLIAGYLFLTITTKLKTKKVRKKTRKHGRKLKLVVDNENEDGKEPRYWN